MHFNRHVYHKGFTIEVAERSVNLIERMAFLFLCILVVLATVKVYLPSFLRDAVPIVMEELEKYSQTRSEREQERHRQINSKALQGILQAQIPIRNELPGR